MRTVALALAAAMLAAAGAVLAAEVAPEGPDAAQAPSADVETGADRPLDPEGPWVLGAHRLRVAATGVGTLELTAPLQGRADEGPLDRLVLVGPDGRPLAGLGCREGRCEVRMPTGTQTLPAGSLRLEGPWHQGRATGLVLEAADGPAALRLAAFGAHGVQLEGQALGNPVTVTSVLVLEGDPRDVDRVALRGPDGRPVLALTPGPGGLSVAAGEQRWQLPGASVELHGDPLRDPSVRVHVDHAGKHRGFLLKQTPEQAYGQAGEALSEHLLLRSPTREHRIELTLAAGPVTLADDGVLSPRFALRTRAAVDDASGADRGGLLVDGEARALLAVAGDEDGQRVLHGQLPAGSLAPGTHSIAVRLERELGPGVVQTWTSDALRVQLDPEGPTAPLLTREDGRLAWRADPDVARWELRARPEGGPWRALPTDGTQASLPQAPPGPWEAQLRGVDAIGNPGPWSEPVRWEAEDDRGQAPGPPTLTVRSPEEGARLSGVHRIRWEPAPGIAQIDASLLLDGENPIVLGTAQQPPLAWDTRTVPDGEHALRLTATGPGGRTSRLVPVTVDNLATGGADAPHAFLHPPPQRGTSHPPPDPMPGRPLPAAVLAGLVLTGFVGGTITVLTKVRRP